ncbi:hypothetical protein ASE67_17030 [Sphingomonas sp. Leaf23]|uniref:hypothetical protein n=1 Tax=Sphingomonas sp. Leaf23 TaxID=1735689 RepID=UPI000700818D|nr:hypothetical protein [Sphingomonas sp. Leaf23]KQM81650.1 hypothetical protein ASE67_17030 [Sphingomonas sp. Leaf23]
MIDALSDLPALSARWLAPLRDDDPELYAELAETIVIAPAVHPVATGLPAGVDAALAVVDLCSKEIGAFRFAPADGADARARIAAHDARVRQDFDTGADIVFVGDHGAGPVFVSPQGIGLLDITARPRIRALARDFTGFLIAQANAFDAEKRCLGKAADLAGYHAAAAACAALPGMAGVEVATIFDAQRFG